MQRLSRILTLLLILSLPVFIGCEGSEGPIGPEGPEGPEGPVGPAGEDGSMMYSGQGAPDASTGENGDYYLNETSGELYGPKNDEGWGTPISLQGPPGEDGEDGEDGSQIYSGSGAPDASLGVVGDYYLDEDNYDLYGPKSDSGWGTPINLKGTANVLYSSWIDIEWDSESAYGASMELPESRITDEFMRSGIVKMYYKVETSSFVSISPLPYIDNDIKLEFRFGNFQSENFRGVLLQIGALDNQFIDQSDIDAWVGLPVRYVLIPGGTSLSAKTKTDDAPIDLDDYEQVKRYFGIRD